MMEHLGELAAESETEQEAAEHFLPLIGMAASKLLPVVAKAVLPMAKKALPRLAKTVSRVTPHLTRGVGKIARTLHRTPQTRHLLRAMPSVARRTVGSIAKQVARGRTITPHAAVRTLAHQTRRVLGTPRHRVQALRRHNSLERRFHGRWGRGMVRPHYRWGRAYGGPTYGGPTHVGVGGVRGVPHPGAVPVGGPGVRYGQVSGGRCNCVSPAYCRCCGQVLR
jgi:hypothetical protein